MAGNPKTFTWPQSIAVPISVIAAFIGGVAFVTKFYLSTKDLPEKIDAIEHTLLTVAMSQYKMCVSLQKSDPNLACTIPLVGEQSDHVSSN